MSRKSILAIAAVAALAMSTLAATDAFARGGGGGGGHVGGGGGHVSGGHASFSRTNFNSGRVTTGHVTNRSVGRNFKPGRTTNFARVNHRPHLHRHHHNHLWWAWCRHHHHHNCGIGIGVGVYGEVAPTVIADAPRYVAPTQVAAVCTNDCDYFIKDEPGCYMAKRKFSTPQGDELRCVKLCDEPEAK